MKILSILIIVLFSAGFGQLHAGYNPRVIEVRFEEDADNDNAVIGDPIKVYAKFGDGGDTGFRWSLRIKRKVNSTYVLQDQTTVVKDGDEWQLVTRDSTNWPIAVEYKAYAKAEDNDVWVPSVDILRLWPKLVSINPVNGQEVIGAGCTDKKSHYVVVFEPNDDQFLDLLEWDLVDTTDRPDDSDGVWEEKCTVRMAPNQEQECTVQVTNKWILIHDGAELFNNQIQNVDVPDVMDNWKRVDWFGIGISDWRRRYHKYDASYQYTRTGGTTLINSIVATGSEVSVENANSSSYEVGADFGVSLNGVDLGLNFAYSRQEGTTASLGYTVPDDSEYKYWVKVEQARVLLSAKYQKWVLQWPDDNPPMYPAPPPSTQYNWQREGDPETWTDNDWVSVFVLQVWKAPAQSSIPGPGQ